MSWLVGVLIHYDSEILIKSVLNKPLLLSFPQQFYHKRVFPGLLNDPSSAGHSLIDFNPFSCHFPEVPWGGGSIYDATLNPSIIIYGQFLSWDFWGFCFFASIPTSLQPAFQTSPWATVKGYWKERKEINKVPIGESQEMKDCREIQGSCQGGREIWPIAKKASWEDAMYTL